jgi:hypothetical protein
MWANHDLCLAKVRLAMGIGSQVEVDKCLERVQSARAGAVQVRNEETEILKTFEEEHRIKPQDTPALTPMNPDEYVEGRSLVDQENRTRRKL